MSDRFQNLGGLAMGAVLVLIVQAPARGQGQRTPWGDPDLQGVYTYETATPMERPEELGDKEFYTEAEMAEMRAELAEENAARRAARTTISRILDPRVPKTGLINRTSLIIDPPNGRLPPLTPEAQQLQDERKAERASRSISRVADGGTVTDDLVYNSWLNLSAYRRCIARVIPRHWALYNHGLQILQTPGYVVIHYESMHDARIIPLDGRPALDASVRQWNGSSRGHWEGNTLVVHMTNKTDKQTWHSWGTANAIEGNTLLPMGNMEFVERLTRIDEKTIEYQVTVSDPTTWTAPWTYVMPWRGGEESGDEYKGPEDLFEYACHEGNYRFMENTLKGSRRMLELD